VSGRMYLPIISAPVHQLCLIMEQSNKANPSKEVKKGKKSMPKRENNTQPKHNGKEEHKKKFIISHVKRNQNHDMFVMLQKMFLEDVFRDDVVYTRSDEIQRASMARDKMSEMKETHPVMYKMYRSVMGQMIRKIYGTMMPKIMMFTYQNSSVNFGYPVSSTTGAITTVFAVSGSQLSGFGLLAAIFDEYRPVGPFKYTYFPRITQSTGYPNSVTPAANGNAYGIAFIDYIDMTTVIASIPSALFADTHKIFSLTGYHAEKTTWDGHVLGQPDEQWLNVSALSNSWCAWKCMQAENVYGTGTVNWGSVNCRIEIEFRQMTTV
jgi:hypothetical protein